MRTRIWRAGGRNVSPVGACRLHSHLKTECRQTLGVPIRRLALWPCPTQRKWLAPERSSARSDPMHHRSMRHGKRAREAPSLGRRLRWRGMDDAEGLFHSGIVQWRPSEEYGGCVLGKSSVGWVVARAPSIGTTSYPLERTSSEGGQMIPG